MKCLDVWKKAASTNVQIYGKTGKMWISEYEAIGGVITALIRNIQSNGNIMKTKYHRPMTIDHRLFALNDLTPPEVAYA